MLAIVRLLVVMPVWVGKSLFVLVMGEGYLSFPLKFITATERSILYGLSYIS